MVDNCSLLLTEIQTQCSSEKPDLRYRIAPCLVFRREWPLYFSFPSFSFSEAVIRNTRPCLAATHAFQNGSGMKLSIFINVPGKHFLGIKDRWHHWQLTSISLSVSEDVQSGLCSLTSKSKSKSTQKEKGPFRLTKEINSKYIHVQCTHFCHIITSLALRIRIESVCQAECESWNCQFSGKSRNIQNCFWRPSSQFTMTLDILLQTKLEVWLRSFHISRILQNSSLFFSPSKKEDWIWN